MDDLEVIMNKRIMSLSLGLLLLGSQMGMLAMDSQPATAQNQLAENTQPATGQKQEAMRNLFNEGMMAREFIGNNGLGYDFFLYQLSLRPKDDALAYIKKLVDAGSMEPEVAQVLKYRVGLIPFSEIEPKLNTLSSGQFRPILDLALKNGEIDEVKGQKLKKKFLWLHAPVEYKFQYWGNKAVRCATLAIPVVAAVVKIYNSSEKARAYTPVALAAGYCALRALLGF